MSAQRDYDYFEWIKESVRKTSQQKKIDFMPYCEAVIEVLDGTCTSIFEIDNYVKLWDNVKTDVGKHAPDLKAKWKHDNVVFSAFQQCSATFRNNPNATSSKSVSESAMKSKNKEKRKTKKKRKKHQQNKPSIDDSDDTPKTGKKEKSEMAKSRAVNEDWWNVFKMYVQIKFYVRFCES